MHCSDLLVSSHLSVACWQVLSWLILDEREVDQSLKAVHSMLLVQGRALKAAFAQSRISQSRIAQSRIAQAAIAQSRDCSKPHL